MLAMCFTGLFIHGVLPPSMISVVLVPIVKNKRISICSKNNYALASISNVYTCFLDASKAFDHVNHFKLFTTLSKRNVPMYIIRILIFWYTSQTMYVRWNNTLSTCLSAMVSGKEEYSPHICFVFTSTIWYCYHLQLRDYQYYCRYVQHNLWNRV